ncbi:hypothetical protein BYT27DRAFT_7067621, partial [Phlegmacium glaucopus]
YKSISVLFHGQEWECYCCFITMMFDEPKMITQVYKSALSFLTLLESISAPLNFPDTSLSPLSGCCAKTNNTPVECTRGALYFMDIIPVFNGQNVNINEDINFENLGNVLPTYPGEIPTGSCIIVGHSVFSYKKELDDVTNVHLATSILFVIVLGTPY